MNREQEIRCSAEELRSDLLYERVLTKLFGRKKVREEDKKKIDIVLHRYLRWAFREEMLKRDTEEVVALRNKISEQYDEIKDLKNRIEELQEDEEGLIEKCFARQI